MSTTTNNIPHEDAARLSKVTKMMAVLWAHGFDINLVDELTQDQWNDVAKCAGINRPSITTVGILMDLAREAVECTKA